MDFFDIGAGELVLILIVALVVMGPAKIVQVSRELGKIVHSFRRATSDLTTQISRELAVEEKEPQYKVGDGSPTPRLEEHGNEPR